MAAQAQRIAELEFQVADLGARLEQYYRSACIISAVGEVIGAPLTSAGGIQLRFCACPARRPQERSLRLRLCTKAQPNADADGPVRSHLGAVACGPVSGGLRPH